MTVALAGRSPATFEIKSANLPLVSLLLKSNDLTALAAELASRFGDTPDFFDNDPLVIDLSLVQGQVEANFDFAALVGLLRGYRLLPIAARGGTSSEMSTALSVGLAPAPEAVALPPPPQLVAVPTPSAPRTEPASTPAASAAAVPAPTAMVIDRPLRSGQQIYARGRDLVVMSMVNAGAEVIADGHIHVYAPLRGKAIAGARGNTDARILALCLEAELISIAGVYRTSEVPLPPDIQSRPTQVRLVGGAEGKLVMESLK